MKRELQGRYVTISTVGEKAQACVCWRKGCHGQQGARSPGAAWHRQGADRPETQPPVHLCGLYRDHESRHGTAGQVGQFDSCFRTRIRFVGMLFLVSAPAANPASSSGAWKSGEKSCFPGGNLGRDSDSYVKPFVFNVLRGRLRSETELGSRAVCSTILGGEMIPDCGETPQAAHQATEFPRSFEREGCLGSPGQGQEQPRE